MRTTVVVGAVVASVVAGLVGCGGEVAPSSDDEGRELQTDEVVQASQTALALRRLPNDLPFLNASGFAATTSTRGYVDLTGPFFQDLGTNGRTCSSCHLPQEGWTITPEGLRLRFELTRGTDPVFRLVDGANSPEADVSTLAKKRAAYSMLLSRGLIRVSNPVPAGADYTLIAVDDPYGHASAADVSTFRRPLPISNTSAISTVMWDGRETQTTADPNDPDLMGCSLPPTAAKCWKTIVTDLSAQSNTATVTHAQATIGLVPAQEADIVAFERSLSFAQVYSFSAGDLTAKGAKMGADNLAHQQFHFGENDVLSGDYLTGAPFTTKVFDELDSWATVSGHSSVDQARQAAARGQEIFNSHPIAITGVKGINDDFNLPVFNGNCTTCHDTPHFGHHSIPAPLDIGLTGDHPEALARTPDMPLYTFQRTSDGAIFKTTDPGRGLITGKFKDLGRFKGPILRGLAARAPYFHNGSAASIEDAIEFYNNRFSINFTAQEKSDLAAFLRTL